MKKLLFSLMFAGAALGASAQESAKSIKIRVLLSLNGTSRVSMNAVQQIMAQYRKAYPTLDTAIWKRIEGYYNEKDLTNLMVPIYERNFSETEVDEMIYFYKTDVGKKMVEKMPLITRQSQEAGKIWGEHIAAKIQKDIEAASK